MPLANATTEVPARKTISEVVGMLVDNNCEAVTIQRDGNGEPVGIGFVLGTPAGSREFVLPARADNVRRTLVKQNYRAGLTTHEHATNVAWRIVRDWLRAQLALVQSGQVEFGEVMLPYLLLNDGKGGTHTLWDSFRSDRALPEARSS